MSLDKSIQHGKSHRKPYRGAKSIDSTCRNHGSCEWCHGNQAHKNDKQELAAALGSTDEERLHDTFDCPMCGCQVIAQGRKRTYRPLGKESEDG